jgi:hypothetical protein
MIGLLAYLSIGLNIDSYLNHESTYLEHHPLWTRRSKTRSVCHGGYGVRPNHQRCNRRFPSGILCRPVQVYDGNGKSLNQAKLDSKKNNTASNISVPINYLACHGGEFDNTTKLANMAHFQTFEVSCLKVADDVGIYNDNSADTRNMQAHNMRHLNEHMYLSWATQDIKKMIDNRHFQYLWWGIAPRSVL